MMKLFPAPVSVPIVNSEYWLLGKVIALQYASLNTFMTVDSALFETTCKGLVAPWVVQFPPSLRGFSFARVKLSVANCSLLPDNPVPVEEATVNNPFAVQLVAEPIIKLVPPPPSNKYGGFASTFTPDKAMS